MTAADAMLQPCWKHVCVRCSAGSTGRSHGCHHQHAQLSCKLQCNPISFLWPGPQTHVTCIAAKVWPECQMMPCGTDCRSIDDGHVRICSCTERPLAVALGICGHLGTPAPTVEPPSRTIGSTRPALRSVSTWHKCCSRQDVVCLRTRFSSTGVRRAVPTSRECRRVSYVSPANRPTPKRGRQLQLFRR